MVLVNLAKSFLVRRGAILTTSIKQIHFKPFYQCMNMPLKKALEESEVIPDVIRNLPKDVIEIKYNAHEVKLGNELKPTDVRNLPTHFNFPYKEGKLYTVIMTDPDAPNRVTHTYREWHHYLVVNVPENRLQDGDVLSEYVGSGPPPGTSLHRYVWLVYEQQCKLNPDEKRLTNRSAEGRGKFSTENFVKKYNLGVPVAANFYQAQYDDYVPILYKQLGEN